MSELLLTPSCFISLADNSGTTSGVISPFQIPPLDYLSFVASEWRPLESFPPFSDSKIRGKSQNCFVGLLPSIAEPGEDHNELWTEYNEVSTEYTEVNTEDNEVNTERINHPV